MDFIEVRNLKSRLMKIRNNKKKIQYLFWEFEKGGAKVFSKKTELLKYLNRIGERALNGHVKQECDHLNSFYGVRQWFFGTM